MFRAQILLRRSVPINEQSCLYSKAQKAQDAQIRAQLLRAAALRGALAAHQQTERLLAAIALLEPVCDAQLQEAFGQVLGAYEPPNQQGDVQ